MKQWRRVFVIGLVIAISSQVYWNVFVNNFRISIAVILLPVLIMTVGSQIHTLTICMVTAGIVFFFRAVIAAGQGYPSWEIFTAVMPGAMFYIFYGLLFKLQIKNKHIVRMERLIVAIFLCDFMANYLEMTMRELMQGQSLPGMDVFENLFLIAAVRTFFAALTLVCEKQYRILLTRSEHETRYQRLFLMTTGLKSEIYLMHKNAEEIERVMSNAYRLYEKILSMDLPQEMQQMGLEIARDVHEIKKDYIRIIQGVEQAIDEDYDEESMSFQDVLQILEASTYHMLKEKHLNVHLQFDCGDNFTTKEHYYLMAVLKNLVNNAVEAIETKQTSGNVKISEHKKDDRFVFEVKDDGPGISEKHLGKIFNMGYSTKFDEKTGNIFRGVGLCGVKKTVEEQFGGKIEVQSEVGRGTKFRIEIPVEVLEET